VVLYKPVVSEKFTNPLSTAIARYRINWECDTIALFIIVVLYSQSLVAERRIEAIISISERFFNSMTCFLVIFRFQ